MIDLSNIWPEWKAVELIGEGSFGKVYRCIREDNFGFRSESAVKVITIPSGSAEYNSVRAECSSDDEVRSYFDDVVRDFSNEVKLMLMLKGAANIVTVDNYKIVERSDRFGWDIYILMEYLTSFVNYSTNKKFTEAEVKKFALDILGALKVCEKENIIHRDIKPANIFVDRYGTFKLGDFGVARRIEGSVSMMSKKGTTKYMAPEVSRGEKYDNRADFYSLGLVMYRLLNRGRDPFIDVNKEFITFQERSESLSRIKTGEKLPPPIDASPEMSAVIIKACEFNANDRFKSVKEFIEALTDIIVPEETTERTERLSAFGVSEDKTEYMNGDEATLCADEQTQLMDDADATVFAAPVQEPVRYQQTPVMPNPPQIYNPPSNNVPAKKKNNKPFIIGAVAVAVVVCIVITSVLSVNFFKRGRDVNVKPSPEAHKTAVAEVPDVTEPWFTMGDSVPAFTPDEVITNADGTLVYPEPPAISENDHPATTRRSQAEVNDAFAQVTGSNSSTGLNSFNPSEVAQFYNNAHNKTVSSGRNVNGRQNYYLTSPITGDGAINTILEVLQPIVENALSSNSKSIYDLPGTSNILASDINNCYASCDSNGTTTIYIELKSQADGIHSDPYNSGPVSRGIGTFGNFEEILNDELSTTVQEGRENFYLSYRDAYIECEIDRNGYITSATYHYVCDITCGYSKVKITFLNANLSNLKTTVEYTAIF